MPNFDTNRIFNESPSKVIRREFENLKQDYSKLNAIKYKSFYENASLSTILENSRFIFAEPYKGVEFYHQLMERTMIPIHMIVSERDKVQDYISENVDKMSGEQKTDYENLLSTMNTMVESHKHTIAMYDSIMENADAMMEVYDDLYEYTRTGGYEGAYTPHKVNALFEDENINLIDCMRIATRFPELYSTGYNFLESCYIENPTTPDDYCLNATMTNILFRMMRDSYMKESVKLIPNMNFRHFIYGIAGAKGTDMVEDITFESASSEAYYTTSEDLVNRFYEEDEYSEAVQGMNSDIKKNRLLCEKAVLDVHMTFIAMDHMTMDGEAAIPNSMVEKICVESTEIEKIPQDHLGQLSILESRMAELDKELSTIEEAYFSGDGNPSKVVAASIGMKDTDSRFPTKDKREDEEVAFTPVKKTFKPTNSEDEGDDEYISDDTDSLDTDDKQDEIEQERKRAVAKARKTEKYASMDINEDEFRNLTSKMEASEEKTAKPAKVEKPEKRPFMQRVQNAALDANVKFKKGMAKSKRAMQDVRNAGKAIMKIPGNITSSLKGIVAKWDEMDDNRRKEYMIKPGIRKKYIKALGIAVSHGLAFMINPLLNIVLAIGQKVSSMKDERIKNEFVRELDAEIEVTQAKIEDAASDPDKNVRYKLIRIKNKLEAEKLRVSTNAKYI